MAAVRGGLPALATVDNALFVPLGQGIRPGLYGADQVLVPAAAHWRGTPVLHLPMEAPQTEADPAAFPWADDGDYLYCGHLTGHYGHFLFAFLARAWLLEREAPRRPRIVILNEHGVEDILRVPFVAAIIEALGLDVADFVWFPAPVRFRQIRVPYPAIEENHFGHRPFAAFCARLGETIAGTAPPTIERPCFLSKRALGGGVRLVVNEDALCERLEALGVDVISPEALPIAGQIRLFRERPYVLGMMGSALHTTLFSGAARLISLSCEDVVSSNQIIIDRMTGNDHVPVFPWGGVDREARMAGFDHAFRLRDARGTAEALVRLAETRFGGSLSPGLRGSVFARGPSMGFRFAAGGPAWRFQREGWSELEDWGCWSVGKQCSLGLPVGGAEGAIEVKLHVRPNVIEGVLATQRVIVRANGCEVARASIDEETTIEFTIPDHVVALGSLLILSLETPDATRLSEVLGEGHDDRMLALACLSMAARLLAAGGAAGEPVGGEAMTLLTWHGTFLRHLPGEARLEHVFATGADEDEIGETLVMVAGAADGSLHTSSPGLGGIAVERGPWGGAVHLRAGEGYFCADPDRTAVMPSRDEAQAWETFLLLAGDEASVLRTLLRGRWVDAAAGDEDVLTVERRSGFRLAVGGLVVNLLEARPRFLGAEAAAIVLPLEGAASSTVTLVRAGDRRERADDAAGGLAPAEC